jgi:hypothetical protein
MASTAHKIYRGLDPQKETVSNLKTAGAYMPGTFCTASATVLTQATAGTGRLFLLGNRDFYDHDADTAYASGDTAVAYELAPTEKYVARFAAATYTYGQELTVSTAGRLAAAASTNVVVAYYAGSGVALSAGDLDEIVIANSYVKA